MKEKMNKYELLKLLRTLRINISSHIGYTDVGNLYTFIKKRHAKCGKFVDVGDLVKLLIDKGIVKE